MKNVTKSLTIFFADALRIGLTRPAQAYSFLRTLWWLQKAGRLRSAHKRQGILIPPIIIFSITNRCNLACKGCYAQALHQMTPDEMDEMELRRIVRESKELGVSFFVIAGGEPFLRPEMLSITREHPDMIFLIITWFLTGMFAGWLVVRHIRTLEPGITPGQGWSVSAGWGCGAIVAALIAGLTIILLTSTYGL